MPINVSVSSSDVRFVNRALAQVGSDMATGARKEIQAIGELVADDAQILGLALVDNLHKSPGWSDMRVGQNNDLVYVVPARRGVRKGNKRKRPNFAREMLKDAFRPAKTKNEAEIKRRFDALTESVVKSFNN